MRAITRQSAGYEAGYERCSRLRHSPCSRDVGRAGSGWHRGTKDGDENEGWRYDGYGALRVTQPNSRPTSRGSAIPRDPCQGMLQ